MTRLTLSALIAVALLEIPALAAIGRQEHLRANQTADDDGVVCALSFRATLVMVHVVVENAYGQQVPFLTNRDFIVYENGIRQEAAFFQDKTEDKSQPGYLIGYYPANTMPDERYHKVRIKIRGGKSLGLKARWYFPFQF